MTEGDKRLLEKVSEKVGENIRGKRKWRLRKPQFETVMFTIFVVNMTITVLCWLLTLLLQSGMMQCL